MRSVTVLILLFSLSACSVNNPSIQTAEAETGYITINATGEVSGASVTINIYAPYLKSVLGGNPAYDTATTTHTYATTAYSRSVPIDVVIYNLNYFGEIIEEIVCARDDDRKLNLFLTDSDSSFYYVYDDLNKMFRNFSTDEPQGVDDEIQLGIVATDLKLLDCSGSDGEFYKVKFKGDGTCTPGSVCEPVLHDRVTSFLMMEGALTGQIHINRVRAYEPITVEIFFP